MSIVEWCCLSTYFNHKAESSAGNNLPDESNPLCREVPGSVILEANLDMLAATRKHKGKQ